MLKGIMNCEMLEEVYGRKPMTEADRKAIEEMAEQEIEIRIDDQGRVWNEGDIYIADVKEA